MRPLIIILLSVLLLLLLFPLMFFSNDLPTSRYTDWKEFRQQFISGRIMNGTSHPIRVVNHMVYSREEKQVLPGLSSQHTGLHDVDAFWLEHPTAWDNQLYKKGQVFRLCDFARVTVTSDSDGDTDRVLPHWTLSLCQLKNKLIPKAGHITGVFATEAEAFALSEKAQRVLDGQHAK